MKMWKNLLKRLKTGSPLSTTYQTDIKRLYITIKSDRIYCLRKQYDAYLEEDKRRKERNEYILDRMDKLRLVNAVVPVNHQPNNRLFISRIDTHQDKRIVQDKAFGYEEVKVLRRSEEEQLLVEELSKKYILIPKIRCVYKDVADVTRIDDENDDWKKKYNILQELNGSKDELKNKENKIIVNDNDFHNRGTGYLGSENINTINFHKTTDICHNNEIPVKDIDNNFQKNVKESYENAISPNYINEHSDTVMTVINTLASTPTEKVEQGHKKPQTLSENNNVTNDSQGFMNNDIVNTGYETESILPNELAAPEEIQNYYEPYPDSAETDKNKISTTEFKSSQYYEPTAQEVAYAFNERPIIPGSGKIGNSELHKDIKQFNISEGEASEDNTVSQNNYEENNFTEINNDNTEDQPDIVPYEEFIPNNELNYKDEVLDLQQNEIAPIETIKPENFVSEIELANNEPTYSYANPSENVYTPKYTNEQEVIDSEHVNTDNYGEKQDVDQSAYQFDPQVTSLDEHNADVIDSQIEAFETEQNEMFYSEQGNYAYQEGSGDRYNAEYAQQYQDNPYGYYEGQEQANPVVINEHEETQRYDPSYEQQYTSSYEQPQEYAQEQQIYNQEGYNQPDQNYEQVQIAPQDYQTQEYVEQQLDNEQGFSEQKENITINDDTLVDPVIPEPASEDIAKLAK